MHNKKKGLEYKLERGGNEEINICTSATKEIVGTSTHRNNNKEKDEMMYKENINTSPPLKCTYMREGLSKRKRKARNSIFFLLQTSYREVHLKKQKRNVQNSIPNISQGSFKSSAHPEQKNKGDGQKLQAFNGSYPRSVSRKKNRISNTYVQQGFREMYEEGELNNKQQTYYSPCRNEKSLSIFDHVPKVFDWNKKEGLEYKFERGEKKHGKEDINIFTSAAKEIVETSTHRNNNIEKDEIMYKENLNTSPPLKYTYRREGLSKRKRKARNSIFFLLQTSYREVHSKTQQMNAQNYLPTIVEAETELSKSSAPLKHKNKGYSEKSEALTRSSLRYFLRKKNKISNTCVQQAETVSSKLSSRPKQKKEGHGRKLPAVTGSSSRSVPKKKNRISNTFVQQGIEEIYKEGEFDYSRRQTYHLPCRNEKSLSIFDHAHKEFEWVDTHIGYKESLLKFAKNMGPAAQSIVSKKLELPTSAEATEHPLPDPIPHPSSPWKLFNDPKGKSVVMNKGSGRNSVSARDKRPMASSDRVGTLSAGSAHISSFTGTSGIPGTIRENVHCPIHSHNQLILQQQRPPPSNAALTNAYTVRPGYQVPTAYDAWRGPRGIVSSSQNFPPRQIAYPLTTVWPSSLRAIYNASGSGFGVWGGHQRNPLFESQSHANPAALGQGFQQIMHNSHMQSQNQLGLEARQQPPTAPEQPLPLLRNMFDAGTSHTENFTSAQHHPTTSSAAQNGEQLPLAGRTHPNLELRL